MFCGRTWPQRLGGAGKTQADQRKRLTLSAFEVLLPLGGHRANDESGDARSTLVLEPLRRIDGEWASVGPVSNLEVQMWAELRI